MTLKKDQTIHIDVEGLYEVFNAGKGLKYCSVKAKSIDCFELYNNSGEYVCDDFEKVTIECVEKEFIRLRNTNRKNKVCFLLTHEEAETALLVRGRGF